jgi:hypothetical protein
MNSVRKQSSLQRTEPLTYKRYQPPALLSHPSFLSPLWSVILHARSFSRNAKCMWSTETHSRLVSYQPYGYDLTVLFSQKELRNATCLGLHSPRWTRDGPPSFKRIWAWLAVVRNKSCPNWDVSITSHLHGPTIRNFSIIYLAVV